jgi:hypothetical protein
MRKLSELDIDLVREIRQSTLLFRIVSRQPLQLGEEARCRLDRRLIRAPGTASLP